MLQEDGSLRMHLPIDLVLEHFKLLLLVLVCVGGCLKYDGTARLGMESSLPAIKNGSCTPPLS